MSVEIETKIKQLQEEAQKQSLFLTQIKGAIDKLKNDETVTIANLNRIEGAIQAYTESLKLINPGYNLADAAIKENVEGINA